MKMYWVKTGWLVKKFFSGYVWDLPNDDKKVYLTFDDGPTPGVTEWVLDVLQQFDAKATFFCIGSNIDKHPDIFNKVVAAGHTVANHTYNHLNGWKTSAETYLEDTFAAEKAIEVQGAGTAFTKLFRPPYGKIGKAQAEALRRNGYRIVMWDVLSADFDTAITPEKCLENVIGNTREGSVIIFHDSVKAFPNLEYALPKALEYLKGKGYRFMAIP
ncbi:polysaccharide deacetylase family protein [Flavobacterium cyanobacteriorum]|uniref:Polysaccharide deacetylase family protein n=1 Tax=Flavobacterium cyanobacteriorum TaxID=2022802 RepID=A0A255Z626_9FLAO|nr:polysaccharide deacetylase family protein [Flavobacterium cyanobacteriorum]OYQ36374.1 polysaccharide deacetylase family protein [Flavobacterium cyanobacteriorum]